MRSRHGRRVALVTRTGDDAFGRYVREEVARLRAPEGLDFRRAIFERGGKRLWVMGVAGRVFEWDLEGLRSELARRGVAWKP